MILLVLGLFAIMLMCLPEARGSGSSSVPAVAAPVQVSTANANNRRDGWFSQEKVLNPANVGGGTFGKLFTWTVDARVNSQVLIVKGVTTTGYQRDLMIVATMAGSIYAFDVNNKSTTAIWHLSLGAGFNANDGLLYNEAIACLSTPVADPAAGFLYASCATSTPVWKLYKIALSNGSVSSSVTITGTFNSVAFDPSVNLNRAALTLANGNVYVGFGSYADAGAWHGWVFAYQASDLSAVANYCASCSSGFGAGFWGSGAGFSADSSGNLYMFTGNGTWDGVNNFGQSIIKLSPTLTLLDWFTPANWATLLSNDSDLSSSRAMLMTTANGSTMLVGGAKDFRVYAIDSTCMGHLQGGGSGCPSPQLWLTSGQGPGPHVGIYGGAFANNTVFMPNTTGPLFAYTFSPSTGLFNQTAAAQTSASYAFPGASQTSYSSNGATGGVVWTVTVGTSAETTAQNGTLRAFNPATLAEIYNSGALSPDNIGQLNKFAAPVIVDGKVYLGSGSSVYQFGLGAH